MKKAGKERVVPTGTALLHCISLLIHEKPPEGGLSPSMTGFCPRFVLALCLAYQHMEHGVCDKSCKYGHKQVA